MNNLINSKKYFLTVLGILITATATPWSSRACSTPVFLYALERWWPDPYRVQIKRGNQLNADQQAAIEIIESTQNPDFPIVNLVFTSTNSASGQLPSFTVGYPQILGLEPTPPFWSSELSVDAVNTMISSPFRLKIAEKISTGREIVWFILTSGDKKADTAALELLTKALKKTNDEYEKFRQEMNSTTAIQQNRSPAMLPLTFLLLSLDRNDPKEAFFVASLLKSEPRLESVKTPIAFAVFGKGRCLPAVTGEQLTEENILYNCYFMGGECSCEVKYQNPGFDLLMKLDWDKAISLNRNEAYIEEPIPELTSVMPVADTNAAPGVTNQNTVVSDTTPHEEVEPTLNLGMLIILVLGGVFLLAGVGTFLIIRRGKN